MWDFFKTSIYLWKQSFRPYGNLLMSLSKKIMFSLLSSICLWAIGIFAFLYVQKFDYVLDVIWDKQVLIQEQKFVENNLIPLEYQLQKDNYSENIKQFNINENKHFINLYDKIISKYKEEVTQRLTENYWSEVKTIQDLIIGVLVLMFVAIGCLFFLYWAVRWNWFFWICVALMLAFFPILYFLFSIQYWSVDRVLSQRMVAETQSCMVDNYAEKSNCIETMNFLNELQVKRLFVKDQMKKGAYPFLFVTQEKEIDKIKFHTIYKETTNLKPIHTIIEKNVKNELKNKSYFIPNLETWGGLYYVNLR